ncbi:MAG: LytTR family DNA-binding domain-containing protein [Raineya sp.]|jgi:two-component system LytT family response regulator|nr:LytTR family DNA-binding domain-containing protein [Raineya sp.]
MRVIIVDDEIENRKILSKLLDKYENIEIVGEANSVQKAKTEIISKNPDLVFLDVSLPPDNIFDMLKELTTINFLIIFVTAHHEYALQAFEYSAVSYLLKPIDENLFEKAVENALQTLKKEQNFKIYQTLLYNLSNPQDTKICLPTTEGFDVVKASEILYCQADSNYTFVHVQGEPTICVSKTLSDIENILPKQYFFRIHKSYLINTNYIKKYLKMDGGNVVMQNGDILDISRRKKQEFLEFLQKNL